MFGNLKSKGFALDQKTQPPRPLAVRARPSHPAQNLRPANPSQVMAFLDQLISPKFPNKPLLSLAFR
jgi:hypothetical protein